MVFLLSACSRSTPPTPPLPLPVNPLRVAELVAEMTRQGDEHPGHGNYHRARNALERELWTLVRALPKIEKGDELLLLCVENVYTRYDANYLNGYLWHWPYLNSRRAVALCERILADYPGSPARERAQWLRAFALRCPPAAPFPEAEADLDIYRDQCSWQPDPEGARAIYRQIAALGGRYAKAAAELADGDALELILPIGPLEPDPRRVE
ncbi:MAG: hypothetical protein HYY16_14065 [Planctomycetes bacterium]|nr:hypothetical protein [Planctomycetota bacterium]